jgi:uncharacterized protein YacL (UPF0231 family)
MEPIFCHIQGDWVVWECILGHQIFGVWKKEEIADTSLGNKSVGDTVCKVND